MAPNERKIHQYLELNWKLQVELGKKSCLWHDYVRTALTITSWIHGIDSTYSVKYTFDYLFVEPMDMVEPYFYSIRYHALFCRTVHFMKTSLQSIPQVFCRIQVWGIPGQILLVWSNFHLWHVEISRQNFANGYNLM